jgi:hypothetical protein
MESHILTFAELDQRIETLPEHSSYGGPASRRATWGNGIGIATGLLGVILGKTLAPSHLVLVVVTVLFAVEVIAFLVAGNANLSGLNLRPSSERREFAEVLDFDLPHHLELIAWLKRFPRERLELMSTFAGHRLDRFRNKLPLLTGGIDTLGLLPIATALFIQFRTMQWPPHTSWSEIVLIGALMLMYWLSLLQLGLRFRLELYDALLRKALAT